MITNEQLGKFLMNHSHPIFALHISDFSVHYVNKKATEMFGITPDTTEFGHILPNKTEIISQKIKTMLENNETATITDVTACSMDQTSHLVDIQIDFLDEKHDIVVVEYQLKDDIRMEKALHQIDTSHRAEAILEFDENLTVFHCNQLFYSVFGAVKESCMEHFDGAISNAFRLDKREQLLKEIGFGLKLNMTYYTEVEIISLAGEKHWYSLDLQRRSIDESGEKLMCYMVNIDARIKTESELDTINQYFNAIERLSGALLYRVDIATKSLIRSTSTSTAFGLTEIQPNFPKSVCESGLVHPDDISRFMEFGLEVLEGKECTIKARLKSEKGGFSYQEVTFSPVFGPDGTIKEMFGRLINIQDVMDLENKAKRDLLTGVYNKMSFQEKVEQIIANSPDEAHHSFIFLDLDDFKGINDNFGHSFGDFLLTTLSKRLRGLVRENDLIGRIGGDEFVVFFSHFGELNAVQKRVDIMIRTLAQKFGYQGNQANIKASMGVALYPQHGTNYQELYENADLALYSSKAKGKNIATIYNEDMIKIKE
ncbi:MAG: GGDEF domain-containing protein [Eubacteriales bacterium]